MLQLFLAVFESIATSGAKLDLTRLERVLVRNCSLDKQTVDVASRSKRSICNSTGTFVWAYRYRLNITVLANKRDELSG
jgi:hypothetical protein